MPMKRLTLKSGMSLTLLFTLFIASYSGQAGTQITGGGSVQFQLKGHDSQALIESISFAYSLDSSQKQELKEVFLTLKKDASAQSATTIQDWVELILKENISYSLRQALGGAEQ